MLRSKFRYYAFTAPGLERTLSKEIARLTPARPSNVFGKLGVQFNGDLPLMIEVLARARTLSRLVVQIGHPFHAASAKSLRAMLPLTNLGSFFDVRAPAYRPPHLICASVGSQMSDSRELAAILREYLGGGAALLPGEDEAPEPEAAREHLYVSCFRDKVMLSYGVFHSGRDGQGARAGEPASPHVAALASLLLEEGGDAGARVFDPLCTSGELLGEVCAQAEGRPLRLGLLPRLSFWGWPLLRSPESREILSHKIDAMAQSGGSPAPPLRFIGLSPARDAFVSLSREVERLKRRRAFEASAAESPWAELKASISAPSPWVKTVRESLLLARCGVEDVEWSDGAQLKGFAFVCTLPNGTPPAPLFAALRKFIEARGQQFSRVVVISHCAAKGDDFISFSRFTWRRLWSFFSRGRRVHAFELESLAQPPATHVAELTITKLRRRRRPLVSKSRYDLRRVEALESNSRRSAQIKGLLRDKARNLWLKATREAEVAEEEKRQRRAERLEGRGRQRVLAEAQRYLDGPRLAALRDSVPAARAKSQSK